MNNQQSNGSLLVMIMIMTTMVIMKESTLPTVARQDMADMDQISFQGVREYLK